MTIDDYINGTGLRKLPQCPRGLEHIKRFWDNAHNSFAAKILPGEFYVSLHNEVISTVLGSCISACITDRTIGVGGMNHFMLPQGNVPEHTGREHLTSATRYGNFAMEMLINEILKSGGKKRNLEVKLFGGGKVMTSMNMIDIGRKNIDFVHEYVMQEGLKVVSEDTGDIYPRKILFYPASGRVRVKKLYKLQNNTIIQREQTYKKRIDTQPVIGDVELF